MSRRTAVRCCSGRASPWVLRPGPDGYPERPSRTVLEEGWSAAPAGWGEAAIRTLLGRFGFTGDDVYKPIGVLSGGEKARLAIARLLLQPANLLLLDEPTNHLDLASREELERALRQFQGTVVMASHDRYFMDRVATKVGEVGDGRIQVFLGSYSTYRERRVAAGAQAPVVASPVTENGALRSTTARAPGCVPKRPSERLPSGAGGADRPRRSASWRRSKPSWSGSRHA